MAGFQQFGKINNEILKVGVVAHSNPGDGLPPYTPVELVGFEVGVMEKRAATARSSAFRCGTAPSSCGRSPQRLPAGTRAMGRDRCGQADR